MPRYNRLAAWVAVLLLGAAAGGLFNGILMPGGRPILGAAFGLFSGAPMLACMQGMLLVGIWQRLRHLPFRFMLLPHLSFMY
jgi:hypothetical protein